jgi:hypothetical protein
MDKALIKNERELPVYLMFQDEALIGKMSEPRRCWAPALYRPMVDLALVRQYNYVFGDVCPATCHLDYMKAEDMKTQNMTRFLKQVSRAHTNKFVIMVVDGASTHKSQSLIIPSNVSVIIFPPYSPELNPAERIWNILRRDYFANRYFAT